MKILVLLLLSMTLLVGQDRVPRNIYLTRMYVEGMSRYWEITVTPDGKAFVQYQYGSLQSFESAWVETMRIDFDYLYEVVRGYLDDYERLSGEARRLHLEKHKGREKLRVGFLLEGSQTVESAVVDDPELWNDIVELIEGDLDLQAGAKDFYTLWESVQLDVEEDSPKGLGSSAYQKKETAGRRERKEVPPKNGLNGRSDNRTPKEPSAQKEAEKNSFDWRWIVGGIIVLLSGGAWWKVRQ